MAAVDLAWLRAATRRCIEGQGFLLSCRAPRGWWRWVGWGGLADMVLRGTNWKLVYSDSKGPSGGKVGPFNALVEQRFAADEDRLVNSAQLGPLKVRFV
jgi:hypothetical protein